MSTGEWKLRLNRYLATCGLHSRRKCEAIIVEGRVTVNGRKVFELGTVIDPRRDKVTVDGKPVCPPIRKTHILINKPPGCITTASDPHGRPTVMDLLPHGEGRLYPAGRLDADTTGLLLMTDDGKLAFRLTHPRYGVDKSYVAEVKGCPSRDDFRALRSGIILEDGPTRPSKVRMLNAGRQKSRIEITIHEGRKHQVKRMLEAVGHPVLQLTRTRVAFLELGDMKPGDWRRLTSDEVRDLRHLVGLQPLP